MQRRTFLTLSAACGLSACLPRLPWQQPPVSVLRPGMEMGHRLRDGIPAPDPARERQVEVAILGSGVAGLFAGWRLAQQGFQDFCVLAGPEAHGNAAAGSLGGIGCPRGAHYLPLPSRESAHVREMLAEFGILQGNPQADRPVYDETALVHAPEERLLIGGVWQAGLVPQHGLDATEQAQCQRFIATLQSLSTARGQDGRKAFAMPLALSSRAPAFRQLDTECFADWLTREGFTGNAVRWYANYCCRDDYGAGIDEVSAWAGIHYFASRAGQAANAEDGSLLTWPEGLRALTRRMCERIGARRIQQGTAVSVRPRGKGVEVVCLEASGQSSFLLRAKRVILAMPVHVAARIHDLSAYGFVRERDQPPHAAWMVSNFLLDGFPVERSVQQPLAWDNVVYGGAGLGWVVATHQWLRLARPAQTVFTAYHAFSGQAPSAVRSQMLNATPEALLDVAGQDLRAAYGDDFERRVVQAEISLRGHAMAIPTPGFLSRPGIDALRHADGAILFAHADLSGLSVFEEASNQGDLAARKILGA
ncbi:MAG: NAD(P)-binding protein [Uliginosibacterium sp.]|nr:NAD(P)-binding protein [Uliginosibacterium sp.]